MSTARPFFHDAEDDEDFVQCSLCANENKVHKYRKSTSSTTLKAHLVQKHSVDPDSEEYADTSKVIVEEGEIKESHTEPLVTFDSETLARAQAIIDIKTRKVRTYFFRIDEEESFCCAFCIVDGVKKSYKPTTSTSGLRRHLMSAHQLDPLGYFRNDGTSEVVLNEEQLAESIAGTNKAKESDVWKYFCRKEMVKEDSSVTLDEEYIYCSLCWNAPVRQIHRYKNSTSSGALKRHLAARHGMTIENRRHRPTNKTSENTEEVGEYFIEELSVQPSGRHPPNLQPPKPKPVKYCRSCGKKDAGFFTKLSAVFDDADTNEFEQPEQISLADLYYEVTGIQTNHEDGMSQLICYLCEANLKSSYKFRKMALETEASLIQNFDLEQQQEMEEEFEILDEEYLDVEPATTRIKRPRLDSNVVYQSVQPKRERDKTKILTIVPKYEKMKHKTRENVVFYQENEDEEGQEIEEFDGDYVEIEQEQPLDEDIDIIEDESEHVIVKGGRNYEQMIWSDGVKKIETKREATES